MAIKYWEFEDAALREKLKSPNVKEIAKIFFENETEAYRFGYLLLEVKRKKGLKLSDVSELPVATTKRYLDFAVQVGLLKHENNVYVFTDRYTKPFRNISVYIKEWMERDVDEDLSIEFANAKTGKQEKRGGRKAKMAVKDE
ncbi:MAG: hypothetical protein M1382_01710 [Candidatus Marsarchaeota archaeon]|jgi:hypothetical protein|nr:hypothetical protein [Candidatus Marsarchaeota archaeon]